MTKMLVGLGDTKEGRTDTIEVIDLESASTTCSVLPNFPLALKGPMGGLAFQDKPMICGGDFGYLKFSKKCFSFEGNEWIPSPSMNRARIYAAVVPSPYPSKSQKLFVTGGNDEYLNDLNTTEVLTEQGWKTLPQSFPVTNYYHCSVLVNSTTVWIIGGMQNNEISSNTFYFNAKTGIWTEGPPMKTKRSSPSCGQIRKSNQSQELSILVAGGFYGSQLSSVEILDLGSNEWRKGPDLPFGIGLSQMVEDQNGGVVLVGGSSDSVDYLDTLFHLPHGGADAEWIRMEQKLKLGRYYHVAFLVPDNNVDCS
jgi:hypothetical protein